MYMLIRSSAEKTRMKSKWFFSFLFPYNTNVFFKCFCFCFLNRENTTRAQIGRLNHKRGQKKPHTSRYLHVNVAHAPMTGRTSRRGTRRTADRPMCYCRQPQQRDRCRVDVNARAAVTASTSAGGGRTRFSRAFSDAVRRTPILLTRRIALVRGRRRRWGIVGRGGEEGTERNNKTLLYRHLTTTSTATCTTTATRPQRAKIYFVRTYYAYWCSIIIIIIIITYIIQS